MYSITQQEQDMQQREALLLGQEAMDRLHSMRVIVFGVGGVGSWCAEALVRSGIRHITIVDSDRVCVTNCNRQLMAIPANIGRVKVEAMRERLLALNPACEVTALEMRYSPETAESFHLERYDAVVDAIDSLECKAHLMLHATRLSKAIDRGELQGEGIAKKLTLVSSMGAALRLDPFSVRQGEFWSIKGDALARALRNKFKKWEQYPAKKFRCVYSEEPAMRNLGDQHPVELLEGVKKTQINGSVVQITAVFGMAIASIIINEACRQ